MKKIQAILVTCFELVEMEGQCLIPLHTIRSSDMARFRQPPPSPSDDDGSATTIADLERIATDPALWNGLNDSTSLKEWLGAAGQARTAGRSLAEKNDMKGAYTALFRSHHFISQKIFSHHDYDRLISASAGENLHAVREDFTFFIGQEIEGAA